MLSHENRGSYRNERITGSDTSTDEISVGFIRSRRNSSSFSRRIFRKNICVMVETTKASFNTMQTTQTGGPKQELKILVIECDQVRMRNMKFKKNEYCKPGRI